MSIIPCRSRSLLQAREADRQSFHSAEEGCLDPGGVAGEMKFIDPGQQFAHESDHFDFRQVHAETGVNAEAETDMPVRGAVGQENEGAVEGLLVAICGRIRHQKMIARPDGPAAQGVGLGGRAEEMFDRRNPAHHLIHRRRDEGGIRSQFLHLGGVLDQSEQPAGECRAGGVVPGAGKRDIIRRGLEFADRLAVHFRRRDDGGDVVCRIATPLPGDLGEEIHVGEGGIDQIVAALHLRIAAAEIGARDVQQPLAVFVGNAEDQHDDLQRIPDGDLVVEVADVSARQHAVDAGPRKLRDLLLQLADLARLKPGVGDLLVFCVLGIIHVVDGAHQHGIALHGLAHLGLEFDREQLGSRRIDEPFVLPLDLDQILMLGDGPERTKARRLGPVHRILAPQHREQSVLAVEVAVGLVIRDGLVHACIVHDCILVFRLAPRRQCS